jgi:hypothetical protein
MIAKISSATCFPFTIKNLQTKIREMDADFLNLTNGLKPFNENL